MKASEHSVALRVLRLANSNRPPNGFGWHILADDCAALQDLDLACSPRVENEAADGRHQIAPPVRA